MEPQNPAVPTPPPPKKNNLVIILLTVLLLVSISASIFLFFRVQGLTKQLAQVQVLVQTTPIPSPAEASAQAGTANWKTYRSVKYNYEFKHPIDLEFNVDLRGFTQQEIDNKPSSVTKELIVSENKDYAIVVSSHNNPEQLQLIEWMQYLQANGVDYWNSYYGRPEINTSVAGVPAFGFWEDKQSNGRKPGVCGQACPIYAIFFTNRNKAYTIELAFFKEYDPKIYELFNQILLTFKFLGNGN